MKVFLMKSISSEGGSSANILEDIVDRLERQVPTLQDPKDVLFFGRAMEVLLSLCSFSFSQQIQPISIVSMVSRFAFGTGILDSCRAVTPAHYPLLGS